MTPKRPVEDQEELAPGAFEIFGLGERIIVNPMEPKDIRVVRIGKVDSSIATKHWGISKCGQEVVAEEYQPGHYRTASCEGDRIRMGLLEPGEYDIVRDATPVEIFHFHLDDCLQCNNHPFGLCAFGQTLLGHAGEGAGDILTAMAKRLGK
jgi:hypothetical protein